MQCIIFILFFAFICIKLVCNVSDGYPECVCQNCVECECFYAFPGKNKMEVPDFLRIEHSPIHGHGIFANRTLEPGLILGPYKGEKIYDTNDTDYAWDIDPEDEKGGEAWMVDALPLDKSNYLRYINDPFGISYGNAYWEARGHMDNKSDEECSDNSSKNCERTCKVSN